MPDWHAFADRDAAAAALAARIEDDLRRALEQRSRAALVVSGGTSPIGFFRKLREAELEWSRVTVVPSDERRVPADHRDSNERMIRAELLCGPAAEAGYISLLEPASAAERIRPLLPFAGVVLGMGADGHTASLFPTAPDIAAALASPELCLTQDVPGLPSGRISLTPRALLDAERVYLLLFGADKKAVFDAALADGPPEVLPVRAILHQNRVPIEALWAE